MKYTLTYTGKEIDTAIGNALNLQEALQGKQDKLTAGNGIQIEEDGTITATVVDKKYIDNNFVKNLGAAADYRVYMASPEGTNTYKSASNSAVPDTIPLRNNSGQLVLPNQLIEAPGVNQAISKAYGDTKYLKAGTDINLEKNLEVNGTTELRGGIKPIKTLTFEMPIGGTETAPCSLLIYNEVEDPETPGSFSFSGRYNGYMTSEGYNIIVNIAIGEYYVENNNLSSFSFLYNYGGVFNKWFYDVNNDVSSWEYFLYENPDYLSITRELHVPKIYDLEKLYMKAANKIIDMTSSQVGNHQIYYHCVKLTSATKTVYVNIYSNYGTAIDQKIKFTSAVKGNKNNNQVDWYYGAGDHVVHCYWDTTATSDWLHCKIDDEEVTKFEDKTNGIFQNTEVVI